MQISVWVDAERWPAYQHRVKVDRLVFTVAELGYSPAREGREAEPRLFNPEFFTLDQVYADHAQRLTLHWRRPAGEVVALRRVLSDARDPAGVPVTVSLDLPVGQALLDLPREWHLRLTDALLQSLVTWLGDDALEISYRAYVAPVVEGRRQRNAHFVAADDEE